MKWAFLLLAIAWIFAGILKPGDLPQIMAAIFFVGFAVLDALAAALRAGRQG